jgi:hypothetical protein
MHTVEVSYDTMLNLKQRYILLKVLFECFSKWVITNNVFAYREVLKSVNRVSPRMYIENNIREF